MASKYLQKYPVPEGFHQILHDFAREVLRDQPDDIIKYGADYFECMTQGKEFKFESKYNIAKGEAPGRVHKPPKPSNMTEKAKVVVEKSNNRPDSQQVKRVGSGNPNNVSHVSSQGSFPEEKKAAKEYVHDLYDKITKDIDDIENPKNDQKDSIDQADQVDQMDQMDQVDQMDQMDQMEQANQMDQQDQNFQEDQNDQPEELPKLSSFDDKDMQNIIKIQAAAKGKMVRKQVNKNSKKQDLDKIEQNQKEEEIQLVETQKFSLEEGQQEFIQEEE